MQGRSSSVFWKRIFPWTWIPGSRELTEIKKSTVDHRTFSSRLVNPNLLVQRLSEKMEADAVYVADVGQNQLWSADNYVMKNGRFLTTGGMGTMGYSIPAAIGAKMCRPEAQVVAVAAMAPSRCPCTSWAPLPSTGFP